MLENHTTEAVRALCDALIQYNPSEHDPEDLATLRWSAAQILTALDTSESGDYIAVRVQDLGTCESLAWAYASVTPYIVARGADHESVQMEAAFALGLDPSDVHVHAIEGAQ